MIIIVSSSQQISGCAILALGIVLHVREGGYATLLPTLPFLNAANICIAAGLIVMFVAFLGCCGAIKENACMLLLVSTHPSAAKFECF